VLRRLPKLRLEPQNLTWRTNLGLRGLTSLKVSFGDSDRGVKSLEKQNAACPAASGRLEQTMSQTPAAFEDRQSLIAKYLAGNIVPRCITPRGNSGPAPLSFPQQQIWLHSQMAPELPLYNELVTIYRHGPLDVAILERVLTEIVRRHEAWRTTFDLVDSQPVQVVHPVSEIHMPVFDLRELPAMQRETEAVRIAAEQTRKPFDLSQGPLLRAALLRLDEAEYQLCLSLHHIIFDGLAIYSVLLPEVVTLYEAFSKGQPSPLPQLRIQYPDFAAWQQDPRNRPSSAQYA
jgi:hypothetical protein